ncbi:MAG: HAD hydrolase family protein, partial [Erysipelotrichaceae bacterium]|nr:HAD hydrolase family protein [Erysipelotrichaceae bacterium]
GFNKFTGLQDLFRSYGLKEEEVIAFGDSENDEEMLKRCGLGIAMGNATEGAKKAADFVTLPCDQDGIGYALRHFGLI